MKTIHLGLTMAAIVSLTAPSNRAADDTFGSGATTFEIEFVTIGDPNPAGSVDYVYRIGTFEVTRR